MSAAPVPRSGERARGESTGAAPRQECSGVLLLERKYESRGGGSGPKLMRERE